MSSFPRKRQSRASDETVALDPRLRGGAESLEVAPMVTPDVSKTISAAFNGRDVDRIVEFFAEDGVFCLARGPETVGRTLAGKAAIKKALADRFTVIPDMRWENEEYTLAGN